MLEHLLPTDPRPEFYLRGPGSKRLLKGDMTAGWAGVVRVGNLPGIPTYTTSVGQSPSLDFSALSHWTKFVLDGKILYIPSIPTFSSIAYTHIYQGGKAFIDSPEPPHPELGAQPVNEPVSQVDHRGDTWTYHARLLTLDEFKRIYKHAIYIPEHNTPKDVWAKGMAPVPDDLERLADFTETGSAYISMKKDWYKDSPISGSIGGGSKATLVLELK